MTCVFRRSLILKPYIPAMRDITINIHRNFSRYVNDFSRTFADYAPTTPVYFTVSLFGLAAGMNLSGETPGLYFGIDELARIHGSNDNLKIIFGHELFHQYHYQIAPEISANQAAWAYMWEEGLATYVSRQMNPGCTIDEALVTPSRLSELANRICASWRSNCLIKRTPLTQPLIVTSSQTRKRPRDCPHAAGITSVFESLKCSERLGH